jgi:propanediol utilization protein
MNAPASKRFVIDRSANHCHLSEADANTIFGGEPNHVSLRPLAIEGEYATDLKVGAYTVLYPWRKYSQIEVAMSDYYKIFGTYARRRSSGDLEGAECIDVMGVMIPVIVAEAHVHIAEPSDYELLRTLNFPFHLATKSNLTTDGLSHIHLDTDQYAAIQGT